MIDALGPNTLLGYCTNVHPGHTLEQVQLNLEQLRIGRNDFIEMLRKYNIGTSVHFIPLHSHPYYRNTFHWKQEDFPHANRVADRILSLPIYPKMTQGDVADVIEVVRELVQHYQR